LNFQKYLKTNQEKKKLEIQELFPAICEKHHGRWDDIVREARTILASKKRGTVSSKCAILQSIL